MNKIKTKVSRETNYVYHMLSVAKCGYDNEYGNRHLSLHSPEDLKILKGNELLITVKGGEHFGELYYGLVCVPASLDIEAVLYYEALGHLFKTGNVEEAMKLHEPVYELILPIIELHFPSGLHDFYSHFVKFESIVTICEVMARNYPIYCAKVWEQSEKELLPYAKDIENIFDQNGLSHKLEKIVGETLETDFIATFCNSLHGGAEAIDISANQDVFGIGRSYDWAVKFISHEFIIYLLKQALKDTMDFQDLMKYWNCIEGLAEFYLSLVEMDMGETFGECQNEIDFYKEIYANDTAQTARELFDKAICSFFH